MAVHATTKMSSKGQVVIPEDVRNELGLEEGSQFVVLGYGDAVILKKITPPTPKEFRALLARAAKAAKRAGFTPSDLQRAIKKARSSK
jgi:AbrB family looped-hinge helix DNA binding protein